MHTARVAPSIQTREEDWFSSRPSRPFFAISAVKRFCLLVWIGLALRAQSRSEKKTGFLRVLRGRSLRPLRLNAFVFWYGYCSRCALNPDPRRRLVFFASFAAVLCDLCSSTLLSSGIA